MGFVNKVMLLGNTTREPELRQLPSGTTVCDFGLATNRVYKTTAGEEKQETLFVDCTAFGRTAEIIAEYCPKGRPVFVEGRLHFESWEDGQGNRRSKLSVIVENVQLVGSRESESTPQQQSLPLNRKPAEASGKPAGRERVVVAARAVRQDAPRSETAPAKAAVASRNAADAGAAGNGAPRKSKLRAVHKGTSEDEAIDKMAEETRELEDADLPF